MSEIPVLVDMIENMGLRCGPALWFVIPQYVLSLRGTDHHTAALNGALNGAAMPRRPRSSPISPRRRTIRRNWQIRPDACECRCMGPELAVLRVQRPRPRRLLQRYYPSDGRPSLIFAAIVTVRVFRGCPAEFDSPRGTRGTQTKGPRMGAFSFRPHPLRL